MRANHRTIPVSFMFLALFASLLGSAVTVTPARAASIDVNTNADNTTANDGFCTLREAINNANSNSDTTNGDCAAGAAGPDIITFADDYTITLDGSQLPAITTEITITGEGAANTIIQANAAANTATYRVFQVASTGIFTLNDVTVRHGRCDGSCAGGGGFASIGGGILSEGETNINNSVISNNIAASGGGIYHSYQYLKKLTIEDSALNSNISSNNGGAIFTNGLLDISNSTFENNSAFSGGAIAKFGTPVSSLSGLVFFNNSATNHGGAIFLWSASNVTIANTDFEQNAALGGSGGGVHNDANSPTITTSTFRNNNAWFGGGGISNWSGSNPVLTNLTLSGNSARYGGGMYNYDTSSPTLTNITFSGNSASINGGGMLNYWENSSPTLTNVIIANSTGGDCVNLSHALNPASNNNLIEDATNACGLVDGNDGNIIGEDPLLGPLADNGGATLTHALLPGSPAIDAGTNSGAPSTDQRGVTRDTAYDIGAYESQAQNGPDFIVNTDADTDDNSCDVLGGGIGNQDCTLREAINAANANADASIITFADDYTITLVGSQLPAITTEITINGNGAANTIIQANAAANTATYRVLEVGTTGTLTLTGVTVRHGRCNGSCATASNAGGGMLNRGTATLTNVTFSGNSADFGGGMLNSGTATLTNVTFSGNSADFGGGMFNSNSSNPSLTNVTFSDNSAQYGGGMFNSFSSPTLTNVTFSGNSASNVGGGMYNFGSSPALTNVNFSGNLATSNGGGMFNAVNSNPTLTNVTFSSNSADYGGGIHNDNSNPTLANVTFSGNTATHSGGGMFNLSNSNPALTNVTFTSNTAPAGGGILNSNSSPTLTNVIIANSASGGDCISNVALNPASSNNLIEDAANACDLTNGPNGNIIGQDPNLGPLADNGGFTLTHALLAGSPAIDAGTNSGAPSTDQRGVTRDTAYDIGAYEYESAIEPGSLTVKSNGKQDGWVLESAETSNKGGTLNRGSSTLLLGDDALNRQYRSVLSFNTSAIPDGANITSVTLLLKRAGSTNGNPFNLFNGLMVDVRKGTFGKPALQLADFKGSKVGTYGPFKPPLFLDGWLTGWYVIDLTPAASRINDAGLTQIRLRFKLDDNNNFTANLLRLYSGNAAANNRPQLFVEYGTP